MKLTREETKNGHRTWLYIGEHKLRLNRVMISILTVIISIAIMWPIYPLFSGIEPFIFGLPLSFAWIILWVIIGFVSMIWLYLSDNKDEDAADG